MKCIIVCPRCKVKFLAPNKKYFYCEDCRVEKWVDLRYDFYLINKKRVDRYEQYYINELTDKVQREFKEKGYIDSEQILPLPEGNLNKNLYSVLYSYSDEESDEENERLFVERLMEKIRQARTH